MFESLTINEDRRLVIRDNYSVQLTPTEYKIFYALYFANGVQINRDTLLEKAYPESIGAKYKDWKFVSAKVILCKLRKKLRSLDLIVETTRQMTRRRPGLYRMIDLRAEPLKHTNAEEKAA